MYCSSAILGRRCELCINRASSTCDVRHYLSGTSTWDLSPSLLSLFFSALSSLFPPPPPSSALALLLPLFHASVPGCEGVSMSPVSQPLAKHARSLQGLNSFTAISFPVHLLHANRLLISPTHLSTHSRNRHINVTSPLPGCLHPCSPSRSFWGEAFTSQSRLNIH